MEDESVLDVEEGIEVEGVEITISGLISALFFNPVNVALICVIVFIFYQMFKSRKEAEKPSVAVPLSPMKKQHMTAQQLRQYDGTNEEGRVCIAVNGKIFDVTKGARYYGPGATYSAFAGRDATRGFATFSVEVSDKEYDDLSDLNSLQMDSVKEWEMQFQEKYEYVGRLLKPGESPSDYSDDEEHTPTPEPSQVEKKEDKLVQEDEIKEKGRDDSKEKSGDDGKNKPVDDLFKEKAKDVEESVPKVPKKPDPTGDHLDSIQESSDKEEKIQSSVSSNECQEEAPANPKKEVSEEEVD